MARLAGQFAGMVHVTAAQDDVNALHRALDGLASSGLRVVSTASARSERGPLRAYRLSLVGDDREGIVRDISRALSAREINVEELDTRCESAPMSAEQLFHASALLHVPPNIEIAELRKTLEALADDLMVELKLVAEDR